MHILFSRPRSEFFEVSMFAPNIRNSHFIGIFARNLNDFVGGRRQNALIAHAFGLVYVVIILKAGGCDAAAVQEPLIDCR